jgi:hypothetical protein
MEAGTVPEKVTISYRGAKYEIGRGKRYYGIWVLGAPASDPIDRWPLTREGWEQAWARYTAIERPGSITKVEASRGGFKLPRMRRTSADSGQAPGTPGREDTPGGEGRKSPSLAVMLGKPARATAAVGLLGLGLLLGLIGLFPGYFGSQSLASQADELVPHLFYLATWAVAAGLIAVGAARRPETLRMGALLGAGLSAVTFGLFFADLGQVISGGSSLLGTGLVLSLLGWVACAAGSLVALTVRPPHGTPPGSAPSTGGPGQATAPPATQEEAGQPVTAPYLSAAYPTAPYSAGAYPTAPYSTNPYLAGPSFGAPSQATRGRAGIFGPAKPRVTDAGPLALIVLAAIGAVAAFAPSWDSYTLVSSVTGAAQTITLGNAFSYPGVIIAGNVVVMIAVIGIAALAALWRPIRHGALLLTGATVALVAQAISALIGVSGTTTPEQLGISQAQVAANGLSVSASGVTPIFWVYCVFVISLVVSIAWMLTAPAHPAMPAPLSPSPAPRGPVQDTDSTAADDSDSDDAEDDTDTDDTDRDGDAEDDAESSYA